MRRTIFLLLLILLQSFNHFVKAQAKMSDETVQTVLNLEGKKLNSLVDSLGENIPKIPLSKEYQKLIADLLVQRDKFLKRKLYKEASGSLNEVATIYWEHFYLSDARKYFHESLKLNAKIGNHNGIGKLNNNIGMICFDYGDYNLALEYFEITLEQRQKDLKQKDPLLSSLTNVALTHNKLGNYNDAIIHLKSAESVAQKMNEPERIRAIYGMLSETYEKAGDAINAQKYFDLYRTFHELILKQKEVKIQQSIRESELEKKLLQLEKENKELQLVKTQQELLKTENELAESDSANVALTKVATKKELQILTLKQEKDIQRLELKEQEYLNKSQKREHQVRMLILSFFILFLLIIAILIYRSYINKQKANKKLATQKEKIQFQKEQLEIQNTSITQSITYAAYIQKAVLEEVSLLSQYADDSFIFFNPRDLVSGDFYWFKEVTSDDHNKSLIATAVDCTGHGVPGAIMSMIGVKLLDQIVLDEHQTVPSIILDQLHKGIKESLHQEETHLSDGMDMALVNINKKERKVQFSGARNPIIYIQDGELTLIKGNKKSIGDELSVKDDFSYTNHEITLDKTTWIYICSDGFVDQFGGEKGGKYMMKRLKKLLIDHHNKNGDEQLEILKNEFNQWKNNEEQVDDVLVMGIKINIEA
ncbi:SpoIIE family protein phosphatase [Flammeovirga yaeyamensis]|uniref:SpoIIE family protein phosphatase n=1 Tax=Flammeovirga yaeyamensis TaxID=367791 RepID=A0AAX1NEH3_9BACT|nr:SpoIIE family protein phosphatase [Flammeovirga yaeyamensis]MBB3699995.1 tetratricopeptide (TPR) repeat protein/predicted nucleic acid-binding Zn ribbon protein [Flammeovirga yaeyamensis]NMF37566.1 SpoIIE family protein phosphatase [Flammeovirga yaeyamensis]QWG04623.1 SpoIIE family protein phosphatase [Flammeovirga yaeyamensis]